MLDVLAVLTLVFGFSMLLIGIAILTKGEDDDPPQDTAADGDGLARSVGRGLSLMGLALMVIGTASNFIDMTSITTVAFIVVPTVGIAFLAMNAMTS